MSGYHRLYELSPSITGWAICVFVVRVFRKFLPDGEYELGLLLADESGGRIEAVVGRRLARFYEDRIKENEWKHMNTFVVRPNSDPVRATSHEYAISVVDRTVVTNMLQREPASFFAFTPFDYILEKTVDRSVLVDVVGALVEVGDLTDDRGHGAKITFKIKDRNKEVLDCEAYNQTAVEFNNGFRSFGRRNIVVALVCWRVNDDHIPKIVDHGPISKVFPEPDVEEVAEIKTVVF